MNDRDRSGGEATGARDEAAWDLRYTGFFDCFNRGCYFEAHEVLEALWLTKRQDANGRFYQALIQVAGAFVHVKKRRPGPAAALLRRARHHLRAYPAKHHGLAVTEVLGVIERWLGRIEAAPSSMLAAEPPRLELGG